MVAMCHHTFASRVLLGSSGWVRLPWTVKRLSCGPIVVELTLPILAHNPDAMLHRHRRSLLRLGLMYKRCNDLRRGVL